jgi:hypothetical protein
MSAMAQSVTPMEDALRAKGSLNLGLCSALDFVYSNADLRADNRRVEAYNIPSFQRLSQTLTSPSHAGSN